MKTQASKGFTIIEVMLFLAITGALAVGILVGSGAAINQQRYRDSVNSLKGFIQDQYGEVTSVINSDQSKPVCSQLGDAVTLDDSKLQARGTSDCLLMGRFVLIEPTKLTAYNVIGQPPATDAGSDDTTVLKSYALTLADPETDEVSWGAKIVQPKTTDGMTTSVLIVRSPLSGAILTYVQDGAQEPVTLLSAANMIQKDFCVDSQGLSGKGHRLAVRINAGATGQSSVEIPLERDSACE